MNIIYEKMIEKNDSIDLYFCNKCYNCFHNTTINCENCWVPCHPECNGCEECNSTYNFIETSHALSVILAYHNSIGISTQINKLTQQDD